MLVPPNLPYQKLPPEQAAAVRAIGHNLSSMHYFAGLLADAVALADMCDKKRQEFIARHDTSLHGKISQLAKYIMLAGRDGAITIWNFAEAKRITNKLAGRVPIVLEHRDQTRHAEAGRMFEQAFPNYAKIRLAVAHMGDVASTPEKIKAHAGWDGDGQGEQPFYSACMQGRYFYSTIDEEVVGYHVIGTTENNLKAVLEAIYRSYAPVESALMQLQTGQPWPPGQNNRP